MISITRDLARQLRSVLRKAGVSKNNRPSLQLESNGRELFVRAQLPDLTIEYREASTQDTETLPLPMEALEDFDGKSTERVTFIRTKNGVEASWEDGRIPRRKCFDIPATAAGLSVPTVDWSKSAVVPGLLQALAHASPCAGNSNVRFDTQNIQLRGNAGEVIATDGHQALVQGGFEFPWQEDFLIPHAALFTCRELPIALPATVCKGKTHLAIQAGDWTIYVVIDTSSRFPNVANVIPRDTTGATTLRLSPSDADFLGKTLGKLPGNNSDASPITVDLNGQIAIRAKDEGQSRPTEVLLAGSSMEGSPVRLRFDRRFLARTMALDFAELTVHGPDKPIVCKDRTRTFVWVPLPKDGAIPPSDDAIRIVSQEESTIPQSIKERMNAPMPTTNSNGRDHANGENHNGFADGAVHSNGTTDHAENGSTTANVSLGALIAEAQALRDYLHEGCARASRLYVSLKRNRKQSKLVSATLASLRQLQQIDA